MVTKDIHSWVVSSPDGKSWELSRQGQTAVERFDSKQEAVENARRLIQEDSGELVVHASDGTIEAVYTSDTLADGAGDPLLELSGIGHSGVGDVSERTNEILRKEWQKPK